MSEQAKPAVGSIGWCDLTVPDAGAAREFYQAVVGWTSSEVDMGGYADFCMIPPGSEDPAVGVCWARGANADIPPVWLVYFVVASIEASLEQVRARGGTVLRKPAGAGGGRMAIVKDPAGAVCALYQA